MMHNISAKARSPLRHTARDLIARFVPTGARVALRRAVSPKRRPVEGLPPGLAPEVLRAVCSDRLGSEPTSVSHLQLSGWRNGTTGAFRVFVETGDGTAWSCVFKNSQLTTEATPGLGGLPSIPGSEFLIYATAAPQLDQYLPERLYLEEVEPNVRHLVVMEDLRVNGFHGLVTDEHVLAAVGELTTWQTALSDSLASQGGDSLYRYGRSFSTELRELCWRSLEHYQRIAPDPAVERALDSWNALEKVHDQDRFFDPDLQQPVHGDANRANVFYKNGETRVVDWEWAGWRLPQFDLASLLKARSDDLTEKGVALYAERNPHLSLETHRIHHLWARLELRLLDASYVIAQDLGAPGVSRMDLGRYLHVSARELIDTVEALEQMS